MLQVNAFNSQNVYNDTQKNSVNHTQLPKTATFKGDLFVSCKANTPSFEGLIKWPWTERNNELKQLLKQKIYDLPGAQYKLLMFISENGIKTKTIAKYRKIAINELLSDLKTRISKQGEIEAIDLLDKVIENGGLDKKETQKIVREIYETIRYDMLYRSVNAAQVNVFEKLGGVERLTNDVISNYIRFKLDIRQADSQVSAYDDVSIADSSNDYFQMLSRLLKKLVKNKPERKETVVETAKKELKRYPDGTRNNTDRYAIRAAQDLVSFYDRDWSEIKASMDMSRNIFQ